MKRVVSVSLGSSRRDKKVEAEFLGEKFCLERIGTDGSLEKAAALLRDLDGKVDCFGLGGMDRYLWIGERKYAIRQVERLARKALKSPVVDGSGLKHTLEPLVMQRLAQDKIVDFKGKQALMLSGVDRWGMAEALAEMGCRVVYGDVIFALGLPIPLHSLAALRRVGKTLLPIICLLPMSFVYPTGDKQHHPPSPAKQKWFKPADIIAGDFHFLRRYLPDQLDGKTIITNTTTEEDVQLLRERGAGMLITTTPRLDGRSFGTNVMEGVLVAISGKSPESLTRADYRDFINRLNWPLSVERFSAGQES
jgi:hypothetical protein